MHYIWIKLLMEILTLLATWSFILIELKMIDRREIVWQVERKNDFADLSEQKSRVKLGGKGYFLPSQPGVSVKFQIINKRKLSTVGG